MTYRLTVIFVAVGVGVKQMPQCLPVEAQPEKSKTAQAVAVVAPATEMSDSSDNPVNIPLKKEEAKLAPKDVGTGAGTSSTPAGLPAGSAATQSTHSADAKGDIKPAAPSNAQGDAGAAAKSALSNSGAANIHASSNNADNYPAIGKMEVLTFGAGRSDLRVDQRLNALEEAVFKKTFSDQTLFDRTQRLKSTILGTAEDGLDEAGMIPGVLPGSPDKGQPLGHLETAEISFLDDVIQRPENQKEDSADDLTRAAVELANYARVQSGCGPLIVDKLLEAMAVNHARDLAKRNVLSHGDKDGLNPDLRYTALGGNDVVTESLISLKGDQVKSQCFSKAIVAQVLKTMIERQDDREALLSVDATGLGFSVQWMDGKSRAVACIEIGTNHGAIEPIALPVSVGDKVELKGLVNEPYRFDRITLAWEGAGGALPAANDEKEEALPFFPPLDYVAYSTKSEHDYEKAMAILRTAGIVAAIAGGVFMPPVALAAPMIAASGGLSEPKPRSDIPVHGGVKKEGSNFTAKIPISNGGKEGVYYVTVWAADGPAGKSIPISRRAFLVTGGNPENINSVDMHHKHKGHDATGI